MLLQEHRGWKSEFAKPYKPLGVPKLNLAPPREVLRQRENLQKPFTGEGALCSRVQTHSSIFRPNFSIVLLVACRGELECKGTAE